jgi:hypothetical protein
MEGYVLNKSLLTEGEQQEVLFALKALTAVKAMDTQGTLDKVQACFKNITPIGFRWIFPPGVPAPKKGKNGSW